MESKTLHTFTHQGSVILAENIETFVVREKQEKEIIWPCYHEQF